MRRLAPWRGRTLVDLGCGSGYWLPGYADEAGQVIGIEPDPDLLPLAAARDHRVRVLAGSAEHIPLPDASADVVHARFAYFWPPNCSAGLAEVLRVLRPGGALVVVDNDYRRGEFADLLRAAGAGAPGRPEVTDALVGRSRCRAHRGHEPLAVQVARGLRGGRVLPALPTVRCARRPADAGDWPRRPSAGRRA